MPESTITVARPGRWATLAAAVGSVIAICATALIIVESALERPVAECGKSRTILLDRMQLAAIILAVLAALAGAAALVGALRFERWALAVSALVALVLAALVLLTAVGGYDCFTYAQQGNDSRTKDSGDVWYQDD